MGLPKELWSAEDDGAQGVYAGWMNPTGPELPDKDSGVEARLVSSRRYEKAALEQAALATYCRHLAEPGPVIQPVELRRAFESWDQYRKRTVTRAIEAA